MNELKSCLDCGEIVPRNWEDELCFHCRTQLENNERECADYVRKLEQQNKQLKEELESAISNWKDGANEKAILFTLNAFLQSIQGE